MQENKAIPQEENPSDQEKKRRWWLIFIPLLLLLLSLGTCAGLKYCSPQEEYAPVALMPDVDAQAESIEDREGMEATMQDQADANYFTLQINPEATFSAETGEGIFEIVNSASNVYPISVQLYLDEGDQLIYESGGIPPDMQIRQATLLTTLMPGTYEATAKVLIYGSEDHEKKGETKAKITVTVT